MLVDLFLVALFWALHKAGDLISDWHCSSVGVAPMFWLIVLAVLAVVAYLYLTPKYSDNDTSTQQVHETILPTLPESDEEEDGSATDPAAARAYISGAVESLDWLNDITKICWPHLCHIVEKGL